MGHFVIASISAVALGYGRLLPIARPVRMYQIATADTYAPCAPRRGIFPDSVLYDVFDGSAEHAWA